MPKNRFLPAVIFFLLLGTLQAQTQYMLSRGAIFDNDSLKGYFFLYEGNRYDKKTRSYNLELYNRQLVLSDKASFLLPKDMELISATVVDKRAYLHFRDYHRKPV